MNKLINIIITVALLLSVDVFACEMPETTLTEFIQRDLLGERLGYKVSVEIDKLQTNNQFEPAWDASVVVTGYKVKSIKINGDTAVASVLFDNSWNTSTKFDKNNLRDEEVELYLKKINSCWKIDPPFPMPRIYPERLLRHYSDLVEEDKRTYAERDILLEHEKQVDELCQYIRFTKVDGERGKKNEKSILEIGDGLCNGRK